MKKVFKISFLLWLSIGMLVSCSTDDESIIDDPIQQNDPPIILDCDYFLENRVLTKNPNAAVDYIITCIMKVQGEIIIEPGVVIEFEQGKTGILVAEEGAANSSLYAVGTSDKPIVFRGIENEFGYWTGLRFGSANNKNELKHVIIEDAGHGQHYGENWSAGVYLATGSKLKMTNTTISNCKNYGLHLYNKNLDITLGNNIYTANEVPIKTGPNYITKLDSGSSYSGNIIDHVFIDSYAEHLDVKTTWRKLDVPYKMNTAGIMKMNADVTIEAGVEIIMTATSAIRVSNIGTLRMNGTAQNKITFRGEEDVPAYWQYISYMSSNGTLNKMSHVEIRNAGKSTTTPTGEPNGGLLVRECYLEIDNITFTNCFDFAINLYFNHNGNTSNFTYANINLNNTPRLFGDWDNNPVQL